MNIEKIAAELTALADSVKNDLPRRTDLRLPIEEILNRATGEAATRKKAITIEFNANFQHSRQGPAFRKMCADLGIVGVNRAVMRVAGAVAFVLVDGQEDLAEEILGAFGSGCVEDFDGFAYLLTPEEGSTCHP